MFWMRKSQTSKQGLPGKKENPYSKPHSPYLCLHLDVCFFFISEPKKDEPEGTYSTHMIADRPLQ